MSQRFATAIYLYTVSKFYVIDNWKKKHECINIKTLKY